uniref:Uncharacterized protein n=1 Tax=Arundo donax TaxID=35708 RepID=A0A0A9CRU3_ARUDO
MTSRGKRTICHLPQYALLFRSSKIQCTLQSQS